MTDSDILRKFQVTVSLCLSPEQTKEALLSINSYYLGDENCNTYDDKLNFIPKYPEKETPKFKEAQRNCRATYEANVTVSLLTNGHLVVS
jgi:hypothetical protein